jgi:uncharacterized membrane protein YagU involved in acid resistance
LFPAADIPTSIVLNVLGLGFKAPGPCLVEKWSRKKLGPGHPFLPDVCVLIYQVLYSYGFMSKSLPSSFLFLHLSFSLFLSFLFCYGKI